MYSVEVSFPTGAPIPLKDLVAPCDGVSRKEGSPEADLELVPQSSVKEVAPISAPPAEVDSAIIAIASKPPPVAPSMDHGFSSIPEGVAPPLNQPIECLVASFNSCNSLWLQLESSFDVVEGLTFAEHQGGLIDPSVVRPGFHCVVKNDDSKWYRARVLQIIQAPLAGKGVGDFVSPQVRVRFVDWGDETVVPLHPAPNTPPHIRALPANQVVPPAAYHCCLQGFEGFEDDAEILDRAVSLFDGLVEGDDVKLFVNFVSRAESDETPALVKLMVRPSGKDVASEILSSLNGSLGATAANEEPKGDKSGSLVVASVHASPAVSVASLSVKTEQVAKLPTGVECEAYCCYADGVDVIYLHYAV